MSTEIKVKRGSGTTPVLADGELGFNKSTKILTIGTSSGNVDIGRPIKTLTQTEYNNLSAADKNNGTIYIIESDDVVITQSALNSTLGSYVPTSRTINSKALSGNITLAASDVGAVPTSRTVNSKALSSNITLAASDVGAVPTSRTVNGKALSGNITLSASDVSAVPTSRTVNGKALSSNITLSASDVSAAPSGYGLGELAGATVEDLNAAVNNGFYKFYANAANAPTAYRGWMIVTSSSTGYTHQTVYTYDNYTVAQRYCMGSTWQEWEWVNPPLRVNGTEYRTTERYNGKPVYQCAISKGYVAQGATSFAHGLTMTQAIDIRLLNNAQDITTDAGVTHLTFDTTNISFTTAWNAGGIKIILKYTKT